MHVVQDGLAASLLREAGKDRNGGPLKVVSVLAQRGVSEDPLWPRDVAVVTRSWRVEYKGKPARKAIEQEGYSSIHGVGLGRDRSVLGPPLANPLAPMVRQNKSRVRRSTSSARTRYC